MWWFFTPQIRGVPSAVIDAIIQRLVNLAVLFYGAIGFGILLGLIFMPFGSQSSQPTAWIPSAAEYEQADSENFRTLLLRDKIWLGSLGEIVKEEDTAAEIEADKVPAEIEVTLLGTLGRGDQVQAFLLTEKENFEVVEEFSKLKDQRMISVIGEGWVRLTSPEGENTELRLYPKMNKDEEVDD